MRRLRSTRWSRRIGMSNESESQGNDEERHPILFHSTLGPGRIAEIFQDESAKRHAPHAPRADAPRDVRLLSPTGRQGEI